MNSSFVARRKARIIAQDDGEDDELDQARSQKIDDKSKFSPPNPPSSHSDTWERVDG